MERTPSKRQETERIRVERYSLSSLLLNRGRLSVLMSILFLWFLFDITHGFGMAPPYQSEWIVEREHFPIDYWALVALLATVISIWALRQLCFLQTQFEHWALTGTRYPHLIKYSREGYWGNVFKVFRANRTTALSLVVFVVISSFYTVLWAVDLPFTGELGAIGFFEGNDVVMATFFPLFMALFLLPSYRCLLANLRGALRDFNEEAQALKSSPVSESRVGMIDLVFFGKSKSISPLDSDRIFGLEPYREYMYQLFTLAWAFLIPDLIFLGLHYMFWKNPFWLWVFLILGFTNLIIFVCSCVIARLCRNELEECHHQITELLNALLGESAQSGINPAALMSARTFILSEVKPRIFKWRKASALVLRIAIPILAAFSPYWKATGDTILGILKSLIGE